METDVRAVLDELTAHKVPGLAVSVVRTTALEQATDGLADLSSKASTTVDTAFLWFSMTKIVTATAAMQLVDRHVVALDDPARELVPQLPEPRSGWPEVTIRHLLSHSSGLPNPIPVRWVHPATEPGRDSRDFARELLSRHRKLRFRPGSKAAYSNLGYIALGELIGAVSGQSYEEYVSSHILEPLSMHRTAFTYDGLGDDVATGYQPRLNPMTPLFRLLLPKGIVRGRAGRFVAFNRFLVDGPAYGGLIGSASDAARFMAAHLAGGELDGHRLVSAESAAAMQAIQARGRKLDVGLGWYRRGRARHGADFLEHLGGGGGFWTMMRIYPRLGLGIVSMGNATGYDHERIAAAAAAS